MHWMMRPLANRPSLPFRSYTLDGNRLSNQIGMLESSDVRKPVKNNSEQRWCINRVAHNYIINIIYNYIHTLHTLHALHTLHTVHTLHTSHAFIHYCTYIYFFHTLHAFHTLEMTIEIHALHTHIYIHIICIICRHVLYIYIHVYIHM